MKNKKKRSVSLGEGRYTHEIIQKICSKPKNKAIY